MTRYDAMVEKLEELDSDQIISLWNKMCEQCHNAIEQVMSMGQFDEDMDGYTPHQIATMCCDGNFNSFHDYYIYSSYGLASFDFWDDDNSPVDLFELAVFIITHEDSLEDADVQEILNTIQNTYDKEEAI